MADAEQAAAPEQGTDRRAPVPAAPLRLPRRTAAYVVFQRTQYHSPLRRLLRPLGLGRFYDRRLLRIVEPLRTRRIEELYSRDMAGEFDGLRDHLPATCRRVLDIGCGVGGIDAVIYQACGKPTLYLFDREGVSDIFYGFKTAAAFYNSLTLTREFLLMNGVADENILTVDVDTDPLPAAVHFDLVISLISWGFHYPVEVYLDYVDEHLASDGVLILDVRRDTGGLEKLQSRFGTVTILEQTPKYQRVKATRE